MNQSRAEHKYRLKEQLEIMAIQKRPYEEVEGIIRLYQKTFGADRWMRHYVHRNMDKWIERGEFP